MKKGMTMPKLLLTLAEVVAFAIVLALASNHYGMADGLSIALSFAIAYVIPRTVLCRARGTSTTARAVLLAIAFLLSITGYLYLCFWTDVSGYSLEMPNLESDARGYYKWALHHYDGRVPAIEIVFPGFPVLMLGLWKLFGVSVVWPMAMNMMFTLTSVVLTGMTTRRLLIDRTNVSQETLLTGGMVLTGILFYYLVSGVSILKEPATFFSVSLAGFVLAGLAASDEERHSSWRDILLFVLACFILAFIRTTYLYFVGIGVIIMALPHWRRDWLMAVFMVTITVATFFIGNHFALYSLERHALIVDGGWAMQRVYFANGVITSHTPYEKFLGYYFLYSPLHRVVLLPVAMAVQFMVPFPWITTEEYIFPHILSRVGFGWYIVGGMALFYFLFLSWRRNEDMGAWAWWPAVVFTIIAYIVAGSVTRYVLPFEPLFVPVAMFVLCRLAEGRWRKSFKAWNIFYVILVAVTLIVCMEIHTGAVSRFIARLQG